MTAASKPQPDTAAAKQVIPEAEWPKLLARVRAVIPEAFDANGNVLNLLEGGWSQPGHGKHYASPVDGSELGRMPMIDAETAKHAVRFAANEFLSWLKVDLDERKRRVSTAVDALRQHADLIAYLLVWEIGKPLAQAQVSVDRCITGVEWYVQNIEGMIKGRQPLGLISNIASWNYPLSVLMHAVLVQALSGNAVIAKTPTDGGLYALTLSMALARRAGLPVALVSGSGGQLSEALVRNDAVACLSFVGGKTNGRDIAASLYDHGKRYMLEMEGVNAYGVWNFSDWPALAKQIKKGFEYGKQRCTAYARWVVQRDLFPKFLAMYLPVLQSLRFGHPLLAKPGEPAPAYDFGPLINAKKIEELRVMHSEALGMGAVSLYEGAFDEANFVPGQDISAYLPPMSLLNVPRNCRLYHNEPFGPIDSIVIVDRVEELIAEMNVSNGSLVASLACDDAKAAKRIADELRAFKIGINQPRSRGDRDEVFGGIGQSWKGCFVGGRYLVHSVTQGPAGEKLFGNFVDHTLLPDKR
ncbi:MAG TPA: aldehyde dehydrogenase family protein [Planctomycetota bacterium]|nr:aldehyde dehydrogenase family protein [Planctomycetota bacterium]